MKKICIVILLNTLFFNFSHGQSYQTVKGTVTEKNSGTPVPYATVMLLNITPVIGAKRTGGKTYYRSTLSRV